MASSTTLHLGVLALLLLGACSAHNCMHDHGGHASETPRTGHVSYGDAHPWGDSRGRRALSAPPLRISFHYLPMDDPTSEALLRPHMASAGELVGRALNVRAPVSGPLLMARFCTNWFIVGGQIQCTRYSTATCGSGTGVFSVPTEHLGLLGPQNKRQLIGVC